MKFIPIRAKILITLLGLTVGVLVAFLFTARTIFLQDKMAYLFDSNQRSSQERALVVGSQLQQWILSVRSLGLYIDVVNKDLGGPGEILYSQFQDLEGMVLSEITATGLQAVIVKERKAGTTGPLQAELAGLLAQKRKLPMMTFDAATGVLRFHQQLEAANPSDRVFDLSFQLRTEKLAPLFGDSGPTKTLLVDQGMAPVFGSSPATVGLWREILGKLKFSGMADISQNVETSEGRFLVSLSHVTDSDYSVVAVTPESIVNRVLRDLSLRTFYVFAFAFFTVLGLSVIFSKSLTANLEQLSSAVRKISRGDFDLNLTVKSKDETGQLAEGFKAMSGEIQRLLTETAEKSRMEAELKTAQAVQSTLFPEPRFRLEGIEIVGSYRSASECGGDWWYYKRKDNFLYVVIADATGHGAPAALLTSAARSAFSLVAPEDEDGPAPGVAEAARILNRAIFETSKGGLLMTGLILRLDVRTGECSMVNCSHEMPFLRTAGSREKPECLVFDPSPRLGESMRFLPKVESFQLNVGQSLFLYTDGVLDVRAPDGRSLGERRMLRMLGGTESDPTELVSRFEGEIENFRAGTELIDDVTLVVIGRSGLGTANRAA